MAIRSLKSGSFSRSTQVGNSIILPGDYESIATTTLSTSASSVTFSSIPTGFTHLQIRCSIKGSNIYGSMRVGNGSVDGGANYARHVFSGNGSTTAAYSAASTSYMRFFGSYSDSANSAAPYVAVIDLLDYGNTSKYKTMRSLWGDDGNGAGEVGLYSGLWMSTSAINAITLYGSDGSTSFGQYSHFALYGIRG